MLEVRNLTFGYDKNTLYKDFSLNFERGKLHCILGQNGSGKSSFMRAMLGLLPVNSGEIRFEKKNLLKCTRKEIARKIAYVPQSGLAVPVTVQETIELGRLPHKNFFSEKQEKEYDGKLIETIMHKLEIAEWKERLLSDLSGGERQKVFLAKALAQETPILFLDEPTNNLDIRWQLELYDLFKKFCQDEQKLIVVVEHDISLASRYADFVHVLANNKILVSGKPENVLTQELLGTVYGIEAKNVNLAEQNFILTTKVLHTAKGGANNAF